MRMFSRHSVCLILLLVIFTVSLSGQTKNNIIIRDLMSLSQFNSCGLKKLTVEELDELNSWLTSYTEILVETISAVSPNLTSNNSNMNFGWDDFYLLEGAWIIANDGQPLGKITTNYFDADALTNDFGKYGNEFNANSIFNEFGKYGNEFSSLSPFNEFTSTPPKIYLNEEFIGYFTANLALSPQINPILLIAWLKQ